MIPKKMILSPTLQLEAVMTDRFKTETLSVAMAVPVSKEKTPLYILALACLKRGTEKFPTKKEINRRLDDLYATGVGVRSGRYDNVALLGFSADMLGQEYTDGKTDIFDGALGMITQMLFHPCLDEDGMLLANYVESEKDNLCDAIESQINHPRSYAAKRCREIMFADDDYGFSMTGTVEQIRGATVQQVTEAYRELISSHAFRVFYVGAKDINEVGNRLKNRLLSYMPNASFSPFSQPQCRFDAKEIKRVQENMALSQGRLVLGFRTNSNVFSNDFYSTYVMAEVFGGSPISKLFMNVRERLGLCYYCSANYDIYKGVMFVSSGVSPSSADLAEREILTQLEEIRQGNVTSAEFDAAINSIVGSYRSISDLPEYLESFYEGRGLFGDACMVTEFVENIKKVTIEDVVRAAQRTVLDTVYFLFGDEAEGAEEDDGDEAI